MNMPVVVLLGNIVQYASVLRSQLVSGVEPDIRLMNGLVDMSERVRRHYNPSYEEWLNVEARRHE